MTMTELGFGLKERSAGSLLYDASVYPTYDCETTEYETTND